MSDSSSTAKSSGFQYDDDSVAQSPKSSKKRRKETAASGVRRVFAVVLGLVLIAAFAIPSVSALSSCSTAEETDSDEYYQLLAAMYSDPEDADDIYSLADIYYEWATGVLQGTIESESTSDELFELAAEQFEAYLETTSDSDAQVYLAMCYYYLDDFETANDTLVAATETDPENAMAWARLGMVQVVLGDTDAAKESYNQAIELDPDDETGANSFATAQLSLLE